MEDGIVLTMRGISISFPGVKALNNVDFTLRRGEIHALMGENGAGKSTLIKVLTGVYEKDAGSICIEGRDGEANIHSPQQAQNLGISTVYQEITLCPNLTVAENMFIGRTKDRDPVADLIDLFEKMRDEDDAYAPLLQLAHQLEQHGHFLVVQRGGRLVQDQHLAFHVHRAGNGHHLLHSERAVGQLL